MDDAEFGQQLATRAMSMIRVDADPDAAVTVLLGFARGHLHTLELARARCAAAVDQNPHGRRRARPWHCSTASERRWTEG